MFYTRSELGLRGSYLFATAALAGSVGGLLAYAIGYMDGVSGLRGWRWIMIIEGMATVCVGPIILYFLPSTPDTTSLLTEEDRELLKSMHDRDVGQNESARQFHKKDMIDGFKDFTIWLFGIAHFCLCAMTYTFNIYLPTVINGLGAWSVPETQALTIPIYALAGITYVVMGRLSDKYQQRSPFIIGFLFIALTGYALLISNTNVGTSLLGCFLVGLGAYTSTGLPVAWLSSNYPRYAKRSVATAVQLAVGNSAGIASPFLYTKPRSPHYYLSYGVNMGLLALTVGLYTFLRIYWARINRRRIEGKEDGKMVGKTDEEIENMGDDSPRFMFML